MGVLKDYKCAVHGYFENTEDSCIAEGCDEEVMVVFLQAPNMISANTKKNDKTLNQLAMDFKMTNMKSAREGESQSGFYTRQNKGPTAPVETQNVPRESRPGDAAVWGGDINGMNMKSVLAGRFNQPVGPKIGQAPETVGINPKDAGNLTGPRAASYFKDPDNLTIKK